MLKKGIISIGVLCLLSWGLWAQESQPAADVQTTAKTPKIVFQETEYDFGKIKQKTEVSHSFVFKNEGQGELEIGKLRSSCGCTAALVSSDKVLPGATGEIKVTFSSRSYRGDVSKTVTVPTNDPSNKKVRVVIKAFVEVDAEIQPTYVNFEEIPMGETAERTVKVTRSEGKTFTIKKVDLASNEFAVEYATGEVKNEHIITIKFLGSQERKRLSETLVVHTDIPNFETLTARIGGKIIGKVEVSPSSLYLGSAFEGGSLTGRVSVTAAPGITFNIEAATCTPEEVFKSSVKAIEEGKRYEVLIDVPEVKGLKAGQGTLNIKTNVPNEGLITVPLYYTVRPRPQLTPKSPGPENK